jgi:hypothetical protein
MEVIDVQRNSPCKFSGSHRRQPHGPKHDFFPGDAQRGRDMADAETPDEIRVFGPPLGRRAFPKASQFGATEHPDPTATQPDRDRHEIWTADGDSAAEPSGLNMLEHSLVCASRRL